MNDEMRKEFFGLDLTKADSVIRIRRTSRKISEDGTGRVEIRGQVKNFPDGPEQLRSLAMKVLTSLLPSAALNRIRLGGPEQGGYVYYGIEPYNKALTFGPDIYIDGFRLKDQSIYVEQQRKNEKLTNEVHLSLPWGWWCYPSELPQEPFVLKEDEAINKAVEVFVKGLQKALASGKNWRLFWDCGNRFKLTSAELVQRVPDEVRVNRQKTRISTVAYPWSDEPTITYLTELSLETPACDIVYLSPRWYILPRSATPH